MKKTKRECDPNRMIGDPAPQATKSGIDWSVFANLTNQKVKRTPENNPYQIAIHPPRAMPPKPQQMAFDNALVENNNFAAGAWLNGFGEEGLLFLGYPYLAELAQRPEYRNMSETIADDATRKGIDFDVVGSDDSERKKKDPKGESERQDDPDERKKRLKAAGKTDKIKALKDDQERLEVMDKCYALSRDDGFFGRSHLFMNFGDDVEAGAKELRTPIGDGRSDATKIKIGKGKFKELKVIEAVWTYPQAYNANNPLAPGWYAPQKWYVMGTEVHGSRLLTFIGHPVADLLKPAYSFGGISLSQLVKPYVDIWLRTRQSVADLIHAFSIMVLAMDLTDVSTLGGAEAAVGRAKMFNMFRDNMGLMLINKASENFQNVQASLGGLDHLQAQAQEHMCSASRIPLVKFTGISPSGLNASSEGEIRAYYDTISAYQTRFMRPNLIKVINFEQMSLFGEIDPEILVKFNPLWELSDAERGEKQNKDAERHGKYVDMGAIDAAEVRKVICADRELPYIDLDPDEVPSLLEEEEQGLMPQGGKPELQAEEIGKGKEDNPEDDHMAKEAA